MLLFHGHLPEFQSNLLLSDVIAAAFSSDGFFFFFAGTHQREEELVQSGVERADRLHRDVPASLSEDQDPGTDGRTNDVSPEIVIRHWRSAELKGPVCRSLQT